MLIQSRLIPSRCTPHRAAGFSLVEIMVGMVIGMFGLLIMMQVFSLAEEQKRTTTSGGDTQSTGAIALYGLQRDIRQAGYGISDAKLIGCNVLLRAGVTLNSMAPLTINHASIPAGDANTDTLLVAYGNTNSSPQGDGVVSQPSATSYVVQTGPSFAINDRVIAAPTTRTAPCTLTLDRVSQVGVPTVQHVSVATGAASMATLFNLGQSPKIFAYAVRGGDLTQCDYMANDCSLAANLTNPAIWVPIGGNVVNMRAEYGRDNTVPMDGYVDVFDQTAPTSACTFARVSAARLALVARSAQLERTAVTTAAPTWEGTAVQIVTPPTNPTAYPIDLTGNATWQNHRYKVFQTVVPLRNLAWAGAQSGC